MSKKILLTNGQKIVLKLVFGVKLISLLICHKLILVVNMPEKDYYTELHFRLCFLSIMVKMYNIYFFAQKNYLIKQDTF